MSGVAVPPRACHVQGPVTKLGSMLIALALASCSGTSNAEPHAARAREVVARPQPAPEPEVVGEAAPEPDPSSTCGQALACCRAYASSIPDVVESSACAGAREAASDPEGDARCRAMKEGWRQALAHLSGEPPDACR